MTYQLTHNWTYYADTVNPRTSNTGLTTRPEFVNEILSTPPPFSALTLMSILIVGI